jgi:hypothetical protein
LPPSVVNVPRDYFSMAGFQVTLYGRFWVTPEVRCKGRHGSGDKQTRSREEKSSVLGGEFSRQVHLTGV